jgi:hypothetical protein
MCGIRKELDSSLRWNDGLLLLEGHGIKVCVLWLLGLIVVEYNC